MFLSGEVNARLKGKHLHFYNVVGLIIIQISLLQVCSHADVVAQRWLGVLTPPFSYLLPAAQVISFFSPYKCSEPCKTASMMVPRISDFLDKVLDYISTFIEGVYVFCFCFCFYFLSLQDLLKKIFFFPGLILPYLLCVLCFPFWAD